MTKNIVRLLPSPLLSTVNDLPLAIQYNKCDLLNAHPTQVLRTNLGYSKIPEIEAVALKGIGVLDTLKAILNPVNIQVQTTV